MATATEPLEPLLALATWLSPAFPVGGFTYSHGIEWAVEAGLIEDAATLGQWVEALVCRGSGWTDAVVFAHAYRAQARADVTLVEKVNELAIAWTPTAERERETVAQGAAFVRAVETYAGTQARSFGFGAQIHPIAYPVAVATAAAVWRIPLRIAVSQYVQAFAANLISAGVRLIPLGQSDGVRCLAQLRSVLVETTRRSLQCELEDAGTTTWMADIASACHETMSARLFRS